MSDRIALEPEARPGNTDPSTEAEGNETIGVDGVSAVDASPDAARALRDSADAQLAGPAEPAAADAAAGHPVNAGTLDPKAADLYREVMTELQEAGLPFLIGGSFAAGHYTGRQPHTKDVDLFLTPADTDRALDALAAAGFVTERTFDYWIAKATRGDHFVDLIYRSANGIWEVGPDWLARAEPGPLLGLTVDYCPLEELIWSKATIMERHRYDGNDVQHLLRARPAGLDWDRLLHLFSQHWQLLLSHLTLFAFVYPDQWHHVPPALIEELTQRLRQQGPSDAPVCRGPLLSHWQYRLDVNERGYEDPRLEPHGNLTREQLAPWLAAIDADEV